MVNFIGFANSSINSSKFFLSNHFKNIINEFKDILENSLSRRHEEAITLLEFLILSLNSQTGLVDQLFKTHEGEKNIFTIIENIFKKRSLSDLSAQINKDPSFLRAIGLWPIFLDKAIQT